MKFVQRTFRIAAGAISAALVAGALLASPAPPAAAAPAAPAERPNVVLVITDDQGYGDLGVHGNPVIRTPNLDRLAAEGVRLERFHVSPVCAPTRASLLTGRYNYRTRAIDTYIGRAMMDPGEMTLAEILGPAGYRTGIFGKWHLGDNYPLRPMDQGFQESLVHRGGGIGQPSDPPGGTSYFDPVLFRNGKAEKMAGYCTDIFTDAAMEFAARNRGGPFFLYLAYNCPHTPLEVPESHLGLYKDLDLRPERFPAAGHKLPKATPKNLEDTARVYGMVTRIDECLGKLFGKLDELDLSQKTLVVFLTDNGPQQPRYNAGMRERKGSVFDGGIRVPCFLRWRGKIQPGKTVDRIAAHIDLLPTILEACGIPAPASLKLDGRSLWPLIAGTAADWPDRTLFFQWHRGDVPDLNRAFAARSQRYKLVQPKGVGPGPFPADPTFLLFDMEKDPLETEDIAAARPDVVERMKKAYVEWFRDVSGERGFDPPRIVLDLAREDPAVLTRQDWRGPKAGWEPRALGHWEVQVADDLLRDIEVRFEAVQTAGKVHLECGPLHVPAEIAPGASSFVFRAIRLPAGPGRLSAWIEDGKGPFGAHQVELRRAAEPPPEGKSSA